MCVCQGNIVRIFVQKTQRKTAQKPGRVSKRVPVNIATNLETSSDRGQFDFVENNMSDTCKEATNEESPDPTTVHVGNIARDAAVQAQASRAKTDALPAIMWLLPQNQWVRKPISTTGLDVAAFRWASNAVADQWNGEMTTENKYELLTDTFNPENTVATVQKLITGFYPSERIENDQISYLSATELIDILREVTDESVGGHPNASALQLPAPVREGRYAARFNGQDFLDGVNHSRYNVITTMQAAGALFCSLYNGCTLSEFTNVANQVSSSIFGPGQIATTDIRVYMYAAMQYANLTREDVKILCRTAIVSHPTMVASHLLGCDLKNWHEYVTKLEEARRDGFGGLIQADASTLSKPFDLDNSIRDRLGYGVRIIKASKASIPRQNLKDKLKGYLLVTKRRAQKDKETVTTT
jgi:hypothetical protein